MIWKACRPHLHWSSLSLVLWLALTKITMANRQLSLDHFKFQQSAPTAVGTGVGSTLGLIILFGVVALVVAAVKISKRRDQLRIKKMSTDKANMRLGVVLSGLNIPASGRGLLEAIVQTREAEALVPVVESNEVFEEYVSAYKQKHRDTKIYNAIYGLRRQLGFEFANRRAAFICTQMLSHDMKVECQIPHPSKRIVFVTPILDVTETRILIKPPMLKGKPANLKRFSHLLCKIRRTEDAEYQFELPILNQVNGKLSAVVLKHSTDIKKLFTREFERVSVSINTLFYAIPEDDFHPDLTLEPSSSHRSFDGTIEDLSVGGLRVSTPLLDDQIQVGDLVVFHLEGANLREDLIGRVLNIQRQADYSFCNVKFINLKDLTRTKINRFLFNIKKEKRKQQDNNRPAGPVYQSDERKQEARRRLQQPGDDEILR